MVGKLDNPKYWRSRAEEVRGIAKTLRDPKSNAIMSRIADDYERLAKAAEQRRGAGSEKHN
jgi:hypothetical protein